jgi:hypothetical protein
VVITSLASSLIHVVVDGIKQLRYLYKEDVPLEGVLLTGVSSHNSDLTLLKIFFADLKSNGGSLKFPVIEFPARVIIVTVIAC